MNRKKRVAIVLLTVLILALSVSSAFAATKIRRTMVVGQQMQLRVIGTRNKVKWSSTRKRVATVNKRGLVTAWNPGKTTIKAKVNGRTLTCKLTVIAPYDKLPAEPYVDLPEGNPEAAIPFS